jgi:Tfp pilus assembly protein PilF
VSAAWLLLAAALAAPGRVVVFPPAGPDRGAPGWIGAAVEETLPRALQRVGVPALPGADRRRALEALGIVGPAATRATGIRLAEATGSRFVLFGSWDLAGGALALTLQPFDVAAAEQRPTLLARGPIEDLGRMVDELARDLGGRPAAPPGPVPASARFAALRALGEGLAARDRESRVSGLRRALTLDPGYSEAALALARILYDAARFEEAREVLARLGSEPVFERERRFLDGACLLRLGRYAEADLVYAGLAQSEPTAGVLANRAAARLRRPDAAGGASMLLRQALEKAPHAAELPFSLGFAHFVEGDAQAAVFWLRDAVRYAPSDARARLALSWALRGTVHADEADEQWRAATALDPALESQRRPDATRPLEPILPSESSLLLDAERKADAQRVREPR